MNAPLFSNATVKVLLLPVLLCLLTGCSFFASAPGSTAGSVPPGLISSERIRIRQTTHTFHCLVAESGYPFSVYDPENGDWSGAEPEIIRTIAKNLKMQVVFVPVPAAALASALRHGRGDVAIGKLTDEQIAADHLDSVFPYAPAEKKNYALMIRPDDTAWKDSLRKAAGGIDGSALLKTHTKTPSEASVEIADDAAQDEEEPLSISVDLKPGKDGKTRGKK